MSERWLDSGAIALAAAVRRGEISPVELVETHIARIEAVNPSINAVVAQRYGRAREEAREAARRVAREPLSSLPPLLGVPCTIKEFFGVEGMPQTGGLVHRREQVAARDAEIVARLRAAGAIVLGVTNVPEGGLWYETVNRIWGRTSNPWDLRRTAGGSSGGEAAILACGGAAFGVGSDVAGSVRIPAAFCGIVSHKPTGGLVSNAGHFPPADGAIDAILTPGPMGRRVADMLPLLRVMVGRDEPALRGPEPGALDPREVTVYPVPDQGRGPVHPSVAYAFDRACSALAARGARFGRLPGQPFRDAFEMWAAVMSEADGPSYKEILGGGTPIRAIRELGRFALGRSPHTFAALGISLLEDVAPALRERMARRAAQCRALQQELDEVLGERGVILHPPFTRPAPRHGAALLSPFDFTYTGIFSVLQLPVTQVPLGFEERGLPVGVQVAAGRGGDALCIAVAAVLEDELGGWKRAHPV